MPTGSRELFLEDNMFILKNNSGNLIKRVETVREKEKLEDLGYTVVSATVEDKSETKAEKSKATRKSIKQQ